MHLDAVTTPSGCLAQQSPSLGFMMGRQRPAPSHVHILSEFKTVVELEVDSLPALDDHQRLSQPLHLCPAGSKL
eukprot:6486019-Amphidinium_carterae.2